MKCNFWQLKLKVTFHNSKQLLFGFFKPNSKVWALNKNTYNNKI